MSKKKRVARARPLFQVAGDELTVHSKGGKQTFSLPDETMKAIHTAHLLFEERKNSAAGSKGGSRGEKLAEPHHEKWLRDLFKRYEGQKAVCKQIAKAITREHGYPVGQDVVLKRLRKFGLRE